MTRATIAGMVGRKPGPAPLPAAAKRSALALIKVTPAERAELEAWARRERRPLAALLREAGLAASRRGPQVVPADRRKR